MLWLLMFEQQSFFDVLVAFVSCNIIFFLFVSLFHVVLSVAFSLSYKMSVPVFLSWCYQVYQNWETKMLWIHLDNKHRGRPEACWPNCQFWTIPNPSSFNWESFIICEYSSKSLKWKKMQKKKKKKEKKKGGWKIGTVGVNILIGC